MLAGSGRVHVEIHMTGDLSPALAAREITLEDRDGDGSPEAVDEDDDDDGSADDDDGETDDGGDDEEGDGEEGDAAGRRAASSPRTQRPQWALGFRR